ncbi:dihydrofolate reductase family protein [Leifsonia sp. Le1]|uniref:dihydrofolate reductase family protein n=1 Tax=Leifsonia sp. Le1 TaxID=3404918 RepID=UPI003EBE38F7
MGTLTVAMFMTIDGFTETAEGSLISPDWSDEMQQYWSGANAHDGQLLVYGRTAFEFNAAYWPTADTAENGDEYRAFARTMNRLPKVVISDTLEQPGWNATVERGPLDEAVTRITQRHDGEIVAVGGISLVAALAKSGLVDHYRLLLMPRLAGAGRSIFADGLPATDLTLVGSRQLDTGALLLDYDAGREAREGD